MAVVLVESIPDPASVGIASVLRQDLPNHEVGLHVDGYPVVQFPALGNAHLVRTPQLHIKDETIESRFIEAGLPSDVIIFLSKHKSESGRPTLTAHPLGNFGDASFGGQPRRLCPSPATYLSEALRCLAWSREMHQYPAEVSFEATHHGPCLSTPTMFLELGSSQKEWEDPFGHRVVAAAVQRLLSRPLPQDPIVVGLGGGHYGPRFTDLVRSRRVSFAHMIPAHHAREADDVPQLAREVLRASPGVSSVYLHEGTLPDAARQRWLSAFEGLGLALAHARDWAPG